MSHPTDDKNFRLPASVRPSRYQATLTIDLKDKKFAGPVEGGEVNGPDIKSENDFGKTLVKASPRSATASGSQLRYSFPPHSYTMLKTKLV